MRRLFHIAFALFLLALIAGCASSNSASAEKLYDLKGKIVSVDTGAKTITIDHQEIPGLMKAMTMPFAVEDAKRLDGLAAGDTVEGKVKVASGNKYVLTELRKSAKALQGKSNETDAADVKANLAKLNDDDRKLAEAQKRCPVGDEPLGSMGVPIKLTLKGETVLICCKACEKHANQKPDEILAKVAALKKQ